MFKRYFIKNSITLALLIFTFNCISVPKYPKNDNINCIANFYHNRRQMRDIQIENRNFTIVMSLVTLPTLFIFGVPGLLPIAILPFTQYRNFSKTKIILERYESQHCQ